MMATLAPSSLPDKSNANSKNMGFRRAYCLADGQLTPPSSPDAPRWNRPYGTRLQLSRLLRRPKQSNFGQCTDLNDHLGQPFVSMTTEPFPRLLSDSPIDTDRSSTSTVSPVDPPELRRVSASYQDLRSLAADQSTSKRSMPTTPLLPSPIIHDIFEQDQSYFQFSNPRPKREDREYKSYEDLHILSCYYDDSKTASIHEIERELDDDDVSEASFIPEDGDNNSTASEDTPRTPVNRTDRETFSSAESNWLANSRTPTERLRRFKARCYQVVQHPMDYTNDKKSEDEITLARVLVGGKPKLVQISRPTSKASSQSSGTYRSPLPPQTPVQNLEEISRFSPYDTPYTSIEQKINNSPATCRSPTLVAQPSYSSTSLVPAPLSLITRTQSYQPSETAFSRMKQHFDDLADPFDASARRSVSLSSRRDLCIALPFHPTQNRRRPSSDYQHSHSLPHSQAPSPSFTVKSHSASEGSEGRSRQKLVNTLSVITSAINAYALHSTFSPVNAVMILELSTPTVRNLRCTSVPDREYVNILGKIFPTAVAGCRTQGSGEQLLSALAAWIIVDLYLCKAMTTLRMQHIIEEPGYVCSPYRATLNPDRESLAEDYHQVPRKPLPSQHHYSFTTLVFQSNSSLHRIPTKARDLLGITLSPPPHRRNQCQNTNTAQQPPTQTHSNQYYTALLHRTVAVQQSVSVIGQKLVETLRGGLGFDEDIWRSLRVLIEVVEAGGRMRESIAGPEIGCKSGETVHDVEMWV